MPDLDERIRDLFDRAGPLRLDDVVGRHAGHTAFLVGRIRSSSKAVVWAVGLAAVGAAAVIALVVIPKAGHRNSVVYVGHGVPPRPPLQSQLVLDETQVFSGQPIRGVLRITNNTNRDIVGEACGGSRPEIRGGLSGPFGNSGDLYDHGPPIASCVPITLKPGTVSANVEFPTFFDGCQVGGGSRQVVGCAPAGSPPLPSGSYTATVTFAQPEHGNYQLLPTVPLPTAPPVQVTVLAAPFSGPSSFQLAWVPTGTAVLEGQIGPGAPPAGKVPNLTLVFTNGAGLEVRAQAEQGTYEVYLTPGTWSVRSVTAGVCMTGISVHAQAWFRDDFIYPIAGCQNVNAPPPPP